MSAISSLSLESFVEKHGYLTVAYIFNVTHKQIWWWIKHNRNLRIIQVNGSYHAWGSKFLNKVKEQEVNKFSRYRSIK